MAEGENQTSVENGLNSPSSGTPEGIIPKNTGKRGRPPGSKNSKAIDTGTPRESGSNNRTETVTDSSKMESAKFVAKGFVSLIELGESFVHANCFRKIEKKVPQKLEEFKKMAQELGLQEGDKKLIEDCAEKIAVRYDLLTKYAPEAVLAIALGQYGLRQMSLIQFVNNITKEKPKVQQIEIKPGESVPQGGV